MSAKKDKDEKVTIFGRKEEDWEKEWGVRHRGGAGGWILIAAGIILLLNTTGVLPWTVWEQIWRFWPLLLVLWGVQIMMSGSGMGRAAASLLGLVFVLLVALFAVYAVSPQLLPNVPGWFVNIFEAMKGVQR